MQKLFPSKKIWWKNMEINPSLTIPPKNNCAPLVTTLMSMIWLDDWQCTRPFHRRRKVYNIGGAKWGGGGQIPSRHMMS